MRNILMACMIGLAGCASTTPVMPLGSGEATVTAQTDWMSGGAAGAQSRVTESAQAHCAAQGKAVQPGELLRNIDQYRGLYDFSLRFRCV